MFLVYFYFHIYMYIYPCSTSLDSALFMCWPGEYMPSQTHRQIGWILFCQFSFFGKLPERHLYYE